MAKSEARQSLELSDDSLFVWGNTDLKSSAEQFKDNPPCHRLPLPTDLRSHRVRWSIVLRPGRP